MSNTPPPHNNKSQLPRPPPPILPPSLQNHHSSSPGNNTSLASGGLLHFLSETKTRLVNALAKPSNFPHSPTCSHWSKPKDGQPQTLNFPFQPVASPADKEQQQRDKMGNCETGYEEQVMDAFGNKGDLDLLEGKVTDMEITVKAILQDDCVTTSPASPNTTKSNPISVEGLDGIFTPNKDLTQDKLPISIYAELIALYDSQQNELGRGLCGSGICCSNDPRKDSPEPVPNELQQYCKNKERNLRSEVLKWNKD